MLPEPSPDRGRLKWDGTITAGNVLTAFGLIAAVIVWGLRLEGRVDQQELLRMQLEKRIDSSEAAQSAAAQDIKAQIRDVAAKLDRLIERLTPVASPR